MFKETKILGLSIDRNLANDFKSAVAKRDDTMSDVLVPIVVERVSSQSRGRICRNSKNCWWNDNKDYLRRINITHYSINYSYQSRR